MNILTIPVSCFTRKLIISKFGKEPIKLKASDTLTGELTCVKPGDESKVEKTLATLTHSLDFELTPIVARHVNKKKWRVGLHLDDYYREKLNEYVCSKTEEGISATVAIARWCAERDIEIDVDISFDALYKDWQRYCQEQNQKKEQNNPAFFPRHNRTSVRTIGGKMTRVLRHISLYSDADLDAIIEGYINQNPEYFRTLRGQPRKKLHSQLQLYIYRVVGNHTPKYICKKFGLTRNYKRQRNTPKGVSQHIDYDDNLRYAVRSFKIFLKTAPPIVLP
jgi:hypothetical protein